ncbi:MULTISPECIES: hypothetical protein [Bradyrhizobium]|uniref:hypothetical protein n=1 Tax=Bradyrhizobium TaxID=374 RepID=UPI002302D0C2|nr:MULTISPECIES: hypothetical protein [Bradyrhizobium]MDF0584070.1 hypothetical protein [Bradyrhizobium yuanmingense]
MTFTIQVGETARSADADGGTPLLGVLRDVLGKASSNSDTVRRCSPPAWFKLTGRHAVMRQAVRQQRQHRSRRSKLIGNADAGAEANI